MLNSGTGKTSCARVIANQAVSNWHFINYFNGFNYSLSFLNDLYSLFVITDFFFSCYYFYFSFFVVCVCWGKGALFVIQVK